MSTQDDTFRTRVYALVEMIPHGQVATYGQIAALAGQSRAARAVGTLMRLCDGDALPWHRVINAQGRVSTGGDVYRPTIQRQMLESEGVAFDAAERCDLDAVGWDGPSEAMPWE